MEIEAMAKNSYFEKHQIVNSAMKKDLLFFGLPTFCLLVLGLTVSGRDGYDGMVETLFGLIIHPQNIHLLSMNKILGLCILIIGLTIAVMGHVALKRFYSPTLVTKVGHQLIQQGIYRYCRHPIYLGSLLLVVCGVPVYSSSPNGLLVLSGLIPVFLFRIKMEETLLIQEFGDEYLKYRQDTKMLVPFIF